MRTLLLTVLLAGIALADAAPASPVLVVPIRDEIGPATVSFVKRSLAQARHDKVSFLLFEVNTPGGRVDSALDIANLIDQCGIPSAAWVRAGDFGGAQSAGALISLSTGMIVMETAATIGSAHPVDSSGVLASEKVVSWVSATFRAWAEKRGVSPLLAMGMVDPDLEIFEIELGGVRKLVDGDEHARTKEIAAADFKVLREVKAKGKLLNLTASEALALGFSRATVASREAALAAAQAPAGPAAEMSVSWSEHFVAFITQGMISGLLISLGFIFIWTEMKAPGVGAPALLAAACFGLVFFGHYLAGLAQATEILLFVLGAGLLVVEAFTPGFGVAGISGIFLIGASLVLSLQNFVVPGNAYQWNSLAGNFLLLTSAMGGAIVGFMVLLRFLPQTPMFHRLVLEEQVRAAETPAAATLVGRTGVALTPLRPAGKAEVDGMTVDVVAESDFVDAGTAVTILRVDGPSVFVRRA